MTRKALRDFRKFVAGYPNVSVLEWLDDEIDYFDALCEVNQLRQEIDEEFLFDALCEVNQLRQEIDEEFLLSEDFENEKK